MLTNHLKDVLAFQLKFNHAYGGHDQHDYAAPPRLPNRELALFRLRFMGEELTEIGKSLAVKVTVTCEPDVAAEALGCEHDLADALHELVDLDYVLLGTVLQLGLGHAYQRAWDRVHAANMAKEPAVGRADGKGVLKPPHWQAADLLDLVRMENTDGRE